MIFSASAVYAEENLSAKYLQKDYDFSENDYKNSNNYHIDNISNDYKNRSAFIFQVGNFNKAYILQHKFSEYKKSSAIINQHGNDNFITIKQFAPNTKANVSQYGNKNSAFLEQNRRNGKISINQIGDNKNIKILQY